MVDTSSEKGEVRRREVSEFLAEVQEELARTSAYKKQRYQMLNTLIDTSNPEDVQKDQFKIQWVDISKVKMPKLFRSTE